MRGEFEVVKWRGLDVECPLEPAQLEEAQTLVACWTLSPAYDNNFPSAVGREHSTEPMRDLPFLQVKLGSSDITFGFFVEFRELDTLAEEHLHNVCI